MMVDTESNPRVTALVADHARWVEENRGRWRCIKTSYERQHWAGFSELPGNDGPIDPDLVKMQVSLLPGWINARLGNLYPRGGLPTSVQPEPIELPGRPEPGTADQADAIEVVLDRFLRHENVPQAIEQAFQLGLSYDGGSAFKFGVDPAALREKNKPELEALLEAPWVQALTPWEVVMDRRVGSADRGEYTGHLYPMSSDAIRASYGELVEDVEALLETPRHLPETVLRGLRHETQRSNREERPDHHLVLELLDMSPLAASRTRVQHYLVCGDPERPQLKLLATTRAPAATARGRILSHLPPIVLEAPPDEPLKGIAPAWGIWEIEHETSVLAIALANGARRDAARVAAYLKDKVDEKVIKAILEGKDVSFVPCDSATDLQKAIQFLNIPPMSDTILKYRQFLTQAYNDTVQLSPFAQGKQGEYLSATEAQALVAYTESNEGRVAKRMDEVVVHLLHVYLRFLHDALAASDQPLRVRLGRKTVSLTAEDLNRPWRLGLADIARSPMAKEARKLAFYTAKPHLESLVALASLQTSPPPVQVFARHAIDYICDVESLPDQFRSESLFRDFEAPPATPAPPAGLPVQPPLAPEVLDGPVAP
ncbi:MAG TPA: hypothetical protein VEB59_11345 [Gemmatimonadales bacterium]|nr:hypothetical protein [Gemmatimonadales bacterium]